MLVYSRGYVGRSREGEREGGKGGKEGRQGGREVGRATRLPPEMTAG